MWIAVLILVLDTLPKISQRTFVVTEIQKPHSPLKVSCYMVSMHLTLGACAACAKVTVVSLCVCLSVYLSVTKLAAMCIVCTAKLWHYRVLYGILNICNVWI